MPPDAVNSAQVIVTGLLTGLIWVVQLVIYPGFRNIEAAAFCGYHSDYMRRIGWIVIPLMLTEITLTGWQVFQSPSAKTFAAAVLVGIVWLSTALLQVPAHNRLTNGHDPGQIEKLVRTNWLRTVAWTLKLALLAAFF